MKTGAYAEAPAARLRLHRAGLGRGPRVGLRAQGRVPLPGHRALRGGRRGPSPEKPTPARAPPAVAEDPG